MLLVVGLVYVVVVCWSMFVGLLNVVGRWLRRYVGKSDQKSTYLTELSEAY